MLSKRIISCLDVRNGFLAKSIKFVDTKDIGEDIAKFLNAWATGKKLK